MEEAPVFCEEGWQLVFAGGKNCFGAESCYSLVEGEMLGIAWALDKARMFTLGCEDLLVSTDHQPLVAILGNKKLEDIPNPRLVRLKEKTLRYRFTIKHTPGKYNRGADAFSRAGKREKADICLINEMDDEDEDEWSLNEWGSAMAACVMEPVEVVTTAGYVTLDESVITVQEVAENCEKDEEFFAVREPLL